jgi:hypothetical protein
MFLFVSVARKNVLQLESFIIVYILRKLRGAASANRTLAILNCALARIVLITRRNMKILTAALLAFDAVILGYDLLQIASFVSLWA